MQPSSHNSVPETVDPAALNARLAHLEQGVQRLDARLKQSSSFALPDDPNDQHANKWVMAGVGWLVGMKFFGFLGAKIGFMVDAGRATVDHRAALSETTLTMKESVGRVFDFLTFSGEKEKTAQYRYMLGLGMAGMALGGLVGAVAGYLRGDRLRSTGDLFLHPIESTKKMFSSSSPSTPESAPNRRAEELPPKQLPQGSVLAHEGVVDAPPLVREVGA